MIQIPIKPKEISKTKSDDIKLRPEIMEEFTSLKPGAFSKYGLLGIMLILLVLVFVASYIPYPESIILKGKLKEKWTTKEVLSKINSTPTKEKNIICEFIIPQKHYNKVFVGMPVFVSLEAYPSQKYGFLQAKIDSISLIASEIGFTSYLSLPIDANTTNNKFVDYRVGMHTECIIIVKEGNLLERFYNSSTIEKK